ncbi:murein hydrolase activator EnvC family protein [Helcococcus bovis]|uniref:murein hydrolase activator EnvC family protein n=1 Tax=Helcococcus bovis TaxID=3153252 RepID=UPI0038B74D3E
MSSRKKYIKLAAYILSAILLFGNTNLNYASSLNQKLNDTKNSLNQIDYDIDAGNYKIDTYQGEIDQNNDVKKSINEELSKLQKEKASLEDQIGFLNGEIQKTLNKIYDNEAQIIDTTAKISKNEKEVNEIKKKILKNTELLKKRLVIMYKMGDAQKVEVLLSSQNFNDFLSRNKMMTTITKNDKNLIETLKSDKEKLDKLLNELNGQKKVLEITKQNLEKEKFDLDAQKSIKDKLLADVKSKEGEKSKKIEELDKYISDYEAKISEKISEKRSLQDKKQSLESEIADLERKIEEEAETARLEALRRKKAELDDINSSSPNYGNGQLAWPSDAKYISSYFGWRSGFTLQDGSWYSGGFHSGVDLAGPLGTNIYAAEDGVVTYAGWNDYGYGNLIIIDHGNGMTTRYAHLSSIPVSVGQRVSRGQYIAPMGTTGYSTGSHLHFEVRINGQAQNPLAYIN